MMKLQKEKLEKKLKIAIFEPYIEGIGGAQRVIAKYADDLQSKGHHVEIFTQRYTPETAYTGFDKIKINIIKPTAKNLSFIAFLKKFDGFDIHIVNDYPSNFISVRNKNTAWVCYSPKRYFYDLKKHYFENASFKGKVLLFFKNFLRVIDLLSAKRTTGIFPISKTIQKRVEKYYRIENTDIVYCGIDCKDYKEGKYEDYLLCVSRFETPKRIDVVIKSMAFVKNKKLKLYIIGDGKEKDNIENLCKKYKNVEFLGRISDKKLKDLYSNCLGVVYVPINEDWSLVPFEAGASGKMTIGSNEGAIPECIIKDKTGFLLDDITPENIAEKIDYIATHKDIAKKLGKQAKEYAKQFDWSVLLPQWEKLILKCAKK
jgi:glycosyltransferase involved in cell wall biosynthesis